ncbi:MAG: universal stress protein [Pseudomonadota bacterium]
MFRHILVTTDGSRLARRAFRPAARLARACGARLTAIFVIVKAVPTAFSGERLYWSPALARRYRQALRRQAAAALDEVRKQARAAGVACDALAPIARRPWQAILAAARARKCDLIVMASHGHGGLRGLLGSETLRVLTHARIPVLVCR